MRDAETAAIDTLIIGCGNVLRGDDGAGPVLVQRIVQRELPPSVRCVDAGTRGMHVVSLMKGMRQVVFIDACRSGNEPGTLLEVPAEQIERISADDGVNLHAFRWNHAIAFARWSLTDGYPRHVTAFLIEGRRYDVGTQLSPTVDAAVDRLVDHLLAMYAKENGVAGRT